MSRDAQAVLLLLLSLGTSPGCGGDARPAVETETKTQPESSGGVIPAPEIADPSRIDALLAARVGKVLVVNLWATWCIPCRKEFLELESLYQGTASRGLDILAIGLDDPAMMTSEVARFLAKTQPTFTVVLRAPGAAETLKTRLDPEWHGEIPTTFVFDRTGRLVARLNGAQTRADIEAVVDTLLGS